jgi:hypothetical protein
MEVCINPVENRNKTPKEGSAAKAFRKVQSRIAIGPLIITLPLQHGPAAACRRLGMGGVGPRRRALGVDVHLFVRFDGAAAALTPSKS